MSNVKWKGRLAIGHIETSPYPPSSPATAAVCGSQEGQFVHIQSTLLRQSRSGATATAANRSPPPAVVHRSVFFADPRRTIRSILRQLADWLDPPRALVDHLLRHTAFIARTAATDPIYRDAYVLPLNLVVTIQTRASWRRNCDRLVGALRGLSLAEEPADKGTEEEAKKSHQECEAEIDQCSICFEELQGHWTLGLPCSHVYHKTCIDQWLKKNRSCPLCRHTCGAVPRLIRRTSSRRV